MLRNYLDSPLKTAIENKQFSVFKKLYEAMQDLDVTWVETLDENDKTYLFLALEAGASAIAPWLLSQHEKNEKIIFALDKQQRTLLHIAAKKGFIGTIEKLIEIAEQQEKIETYLAKDKTGSTVLHYASKNPAPEQNNITELLISTIKKYTDLPTYTNQIDESGNTALHLAMIHSPGSVVDNLMTAGAKLNLLNNNGESAFALFSSMTIERQNAIFRYLSEKNQKIIFQYYENLHSDALKSEDQDRIDEIEEHRLALARTVSLKFFADFLIKHHIHEVSFQSFIKLPLHKQMAMLLVLSKENQDEFLTSYENLFEEILESETQDKIDETANNILVLAYKVNPQFFADFCHKHDFDEENEDIKIAIDEINKKMEMKDFAILDVPANESIGTDREKVAFLLSMFEEYLQTLNEKPAYAYTELKSIAYPLLPLTAYLLLVFTPIIKYLADMEQATSAYNNDGSFNKTKYDLYHDVHPNYYRAYGLFGFIGGGVPFIGFLFIGAYLLDNPLSSSILRSEWKHLIDLLEKYLDDHENDLLENPDYPAVQNLQTLKDEVNTLEEQNRFTIPFLNWDIYYPSQSLPVLQHSFTQLVEAIKTVQKDFTIFSSSITFFKKSAEDNGDCIIDISLPEPEKQAIYDSEDDENMELLQRFNLGSP